MISEQYKQAVLWSAINGLYNAFREYDDMSGARDRLAHRLELIAHQIRTRQKLPDGRDAQVEDESVIE